MSQEYNTIARKPRRNRSARNRPVLVTETEETTEDTPPTTDNLALDVTPTTGETETVTAPAAPSRNPLHLPKFFSKVEHNTEESTTGTDEVVEARMARAKKSLNGKAAATTEVAATEDTKPAAKAKPTPAAPAKPRLFKTRHIIGIVAYLFGANWLLPAEAGYIKSANINKVYYTIASLHVQIDTALVVNIVTLIICLYLLVAFDLLPNGKQLSASQTSQKRGVKTTSSNSSSGTAVKTPQPTVRQGVKGENDDLYQSYRTNQRKKR